MTNAEKRKNKSRKNSPASGAESMTCGAAVLDILAPKAHDVPMILNDSSAASAVNGMSVLPSVETVLSVDSVPNSVPKEGKKMSKTQETAAPAAYEIKKNVKVFDLATFKSEKVEVKTQFTPAPDYKSALERVQTLPNAETIIVSAFNSILERAALNAAKTSALGPDKVSRKVVLDFVNAFRMRPDIAAIVTLEKGQPGWKEQYNRQTDTLLEKVAANPFMLDSIRQTAALSVDSDDDAEDSE
jgi:hypothetical protein